MRYVIIALAVLAASNACKDLLRSRRSMRIVALDQAPEMAAPEPD
ncbi:hypothetical protein [Gordonibacter sp. Marseille-P4307]|nr:hypothetical protein [Gordonibacter sp. Marseille-P4307]